MEKASAKQCKVREKTAKSKNFQLVQNIYLHSPANGSKINVKLTGRAFGRQLMVHTANQKTP